jgi:hypothetical protein
MLITACYVRSKSRMLNMMCSGGKESTLLKMTGSEMLSYGSMRS